MTFRNRLANFLHQIINLPVGRSNFNRRIKQPSRSNKLLSWLWRMRKFIISWRSRNVNCLMNMLVELIKSKWAIVQCAWKTKTMLNQNFFTGAITVVHSPNLRQCHVRFVNQKQPIVRKIINQSRRLLARFSVGQIARIILNPFHKTSFLQHLQIIFGTLAQPLRL